MAGEQVFLAVVTVAELRYGALVAGWGDQCRRRLEQSIAATTVVPVSDSDAAAGFERLAGRFPRTIPDTEERRGKNRTNTD